MGGHPAEKLTLKDRWYYCVRCGYTEDRDVNAAKNILLKGYGLFDPGGNFPECGQKADERAISKRASTQNRNHIKLKEALPSYEYNSQIKM